MSFIHVKKVTVTAPDGALVEQYAVQCMAIQSPQGKQLIPNPAGKEASLFPSLEAAEGAVRRAGFDYIFEGRKVYLSPVTSSRNAMPTASAWNSDLRSFVPVLIERLGDREPSVVANAATALGALEATEAIESLVNELGHEDPAVRRAVAEAFSKIGSVAIGPLQAAYVEALSSQEKNASHIRLTVMLAYQELLMRQKGIQGAVLPLVAEALNDENWLVRGAAAQTVAIAAQAMKEETENHSNLS